MFSELGVLAGAVPAVQGWTICRPHSVHTALGQVFELPLLSFPVSFVLGLESLSPVDQFLAPPSSFSPPISFFTPLEKKSPPRKQKCSFPIFYHSGINRLEIFIQVMVNKSNIFITQLSLEIEIYISYVSFPKITYITCLVS